MFLLCQPARQRAEWRVLGAGACLPPCFPHRVPPSCSRGALLACGTHNGPHPDMPQWALLKASSTSAPSWLPVTQQHLRAELPVCRPWPTASSPSARLFAVRRRHQDKPLALGEQGALPDLSVPAYSARVPGAVTAPCVRHSCTLWGSLHPSGLIPCSNYS